MKVNKAIIYGLVCIATVGSAYVAANYCGKYKANKLVEEAKSELIESADIQVSSDEYSTNKPKYNVKMEEGYVSYVITYSDIDGNKLNVNSVPFMVSNNGEVYQDIEQAKKAEVIKDYIQDDVYYFQLKSGADIAWYATPSDTTSIDNWSDDMADVTLAAHATDEYDSKVVRQNIILDYTDGVNVTFDEYIKQ